ncbi:MAG: hypothetical protein ACOCWH_07160, partial [Spirochaetota bacterium]
MEPVLKQIETIITIASEGLGITPRIESNIITSILIITVLYIATTVVTRLGFRYIKDMHLRYRTRKNTSYSAAFIALL